MASCGDGLHDWVRLSSSLAGSLAPLKCTKCGLRTTPPPPPASLPPGAGAGVRIPDPPVMGVVALGYLSRAGEWGLMRNQGGVRFGLTGRFTVASRDLRHIVKSAGGHVLLMNMIDADEEQVKNLDYLVAGQDSDPIMTSKARVEDVDIINEAGLMAMLWPSITELRALGVTGEVQVPF